MLAEERKELPDRKFIESKKRKIEEIMKEIQTAKDIESKPVPVEFRELRHPNKK